MYSSYILLYLFNATQIDSKYSVEKPRHARNALDIEL